jgi:hypothetical protein
LPWGGRQLGDEFAAHTVQLGDRQYDGLREINVKRSQKKRSSAEFAKLHSKSELAKRVSSGGLQRNAGKNAMALAVDQKRVAHPASH